MKKYFLLLVFVFISFSSNAQCFESLMKKGRQNINIGNYSAALELFTKALKCSDAPRTNTDTLALISQLTFECNQGIVSIELENADQVFLKGDLDSAFAVYNKYPDLLTVDPRRLFYMGYIYYSATGLIDYRQALKYFVEAENLGVADPSRYYVGLLYVQGKGVPADTARAIEWFTKSATTGNQDAMFSLGSIYDARKPVQQLNRIQAMKWYKQAAEKGHKGATDRLEILEKEQSKIDLLKADISFKMGSFLVAERFYSNYDRFLSPLQNYRLGFIYSDTGITRDYPKALRYLRKSSDQGSSDAIYVLGNIYKEGKGVKPDTAEALKWYTQAAVLGNADAMFTIGYLYDHKQGVKQDNTEALLWYRKSADLGNAQAMVRIGYLYYYGLGVKQDYTEALSWYRKAAGLGHPQAMFYIGYMCANSEGVKQNYSEAMSWYRKAVDAGDAPAMKRIGDLYYYGQGVKQDYSEAISWYRKAADFGIVSAMNSLGNFYRDGIVVNHDTTEALKWYQKAADLGNVNAMIEIGDIFKSLKNYTDAVLWYRKAADYGSALSMYNIGEIFDKGLGFNKDYKEAFKWYKKSAESGHRFANYMVFLKYKYGLGVEKDKKEARRWKRKYHDQLW